MKRRLTKSHNARVLGLCICFFLLLAYMAVSLFVTGGDNIRQPQFNENEGKHHWHSRSLLGTNNSQGTQQSGGRQSEEKGEYPPDYFDLETKRKGAIVLHIIGVFYMFLGLAIVCDEFFVPALHIISTSLGISDDVAGATFMAAGGSAPELFTSFLGVFVAKSNVGFGTIVGSAVFNVLFVIGMCVIFSRGVLLLTWWPLVRDCVFYSLALGLLIAFFSSGSQIEIWESAILIGVYILYVIFMAFNIKIELRVKRALGSSKVLPSPQLSVESAFHRRMSNFRNGAMQLVIHTLDPISEATADNKFQKIKMQVDIHVQHEYIKDSETSLVLKEQFSYSRESSVTSDIDLRRSNTIDNTVDEKRVAFQNYSKKYDSADSEVLRRKALMNNFINNGTIKDDIWSSKEGEKDGISGDHLQTETSKESTPKRKFGNNNSEMSREPSYCGSLISYENNNKERQSWCEESQRSKRCSAGQNLPDDGRNSKASTWSHGSERVPKHSCHSHRGISRASVRDTGPPAQDTIDLEDLEDEKPLDLSWPSSFLGKIWYLIKAPIVFTLVATLPDVKRPNCRKFFIITFFGSIIWIMGYSYLMVWWATMIGEALYIPIEVMGLTFLAAGTSVPDLITSVLVARQGLGDMAVSSSIGSNIFDVTIGLPIPWFIWSASHSAQAMVVKSEGLFCSTILLFVMLIAVIISIAICRFKMSRGLGALMFLFYVVFLTVTLLMEFKVFSCFL